jgi:GDPmannose 4,6-dehydratase
MKKKVALIFGGSGQDGTLMSELLVQKGYKVYSISRLLKKNINKKKNTIIYLKINYYNNNEIRKIIRESNCSEIYFFAGQPSLRISYEKEYETIKSHALPLYYILEAVRNIKKKVKVFNAGSGLIFKNDNKIIDENSLLYPTSPYAFGKLISFNLIKYFRQNHGVHCFTGIFFNHESFLRSQDHLFPKIINFLKNKDYLKKKLILGDVNIKRDWGWAPEYMKIIFYLMKRINFDDFIIATGTSVSIKYILEYLFKKFKLNWKHHVTFSNRFLIKSEAKTTIVSIKKLKKFSSHYPRIKINQILDMLIK